MEVVDIIKVASSETVEIKPEDIESDSENIPEDTQRSPLKTRESLEIQKTHQEERQSTVSNKSVDTVEIKPEDIESDSENIPEDTQRSPLKTRESLEIQKTHQEERQSTVSNKSVDTVEIKPEDIESDPENLPEDTQRSSLETQESPKIENTYQEERQCTVSNKSVHTVKIKPKDIESDPEILPEDTQRSPLETRESLEIEKTHQEERQSTVRNKSVDTVEFKPEEIESDPENIPKDTQRSSLETQESLKIENTHQEERHCTVSNESVDTVEIKLEDIESDSETLEQTLRTAESPRITNIHPEEPRCKTSNHADEGDTGNRNKKPEFRYICNAIIHNIQIADVNRDFDKEHIKIGTPSNRVQETVNNSKIVPVASKPLTELKLKNNISVHNTLFSISSLNKDKKNQGTLAKNPTKYFSDRTIHHEEIIKHGPEYGCVYCPYLGTGWRIINNHIRHNHRDPAIEGGITQCPHCPKKVVKLAKHISYSHDKRKQTTNGDNIVFCGHCDYKTIYKQQLREHIQAKHVDFPGDRMICKECGKSLKNKSGFNRHFRTVHHPETMKNHKCDYCDFTTAASRDLKRHIFRHKNPEGGFNCKQCEFHARNFNEFLKHKKNEHQTWKQCHICPYKTKNIVSLNLHLIYHQDKKDEEKLTYRCDQCDYKTYRSHNLTIHMLNHKKPEEKEVFQCYHCDFKAFRKDNLKSHIFRHDVYKTPLKCFICDFTTSSKYELTRHVDIHAGNQTGTEKPGMKKRKADQREDKTDKNESKRKRNKNNKKKMYRDTDSD